MQLKKMSWNRYIKPYLPYFILGPLCMIVEVIGEVVMPRLLAVVINNANEGTLKTGTSLGIMALMILTALIMMAGGIGGAYFASKASVSFAADLREDGNGVVHLFACRCSLEIVGGCDNLQIVNDDNRHALVVFNVRFCYPHNIVNG